VLLSGGDYHDGMQGCGLTITHGLAHCGFGDRLVEAFDGMPRDAFFGYLCHTWADELSAELGSNSKGFLRTRQPRLAEQLGGFISTLDHETVEKYMCPVTTWTKFGQCINNLGWVWQAPNVPRIAELCFVHLGWTETTKLIRVFRRNLWEGVIYRILLSVSSFFDTILGYYQGYYQFYFKPNASFTPLTSVLQDGKDLTVTFTDLREKLRQTAKGWPFDWCRTKFTDDKLTEKALASLPQEVRDRYSFTVSKVQAEDSDPNPLSIWIPLCYIPPSMLAHFRQQLILRRQLPSMSSDSEEEHPSLEPSTSQQPHHLSTPMSNTVSNIAESSVMGCHVETCFAQSQPPAVHFILDLTNLPDHSFSGEGTVRGHSGSPYTASALLTPLPADFSPAAHFRGLLD